MSNSVHLGEHMQTSCLHCGSLFRVSSEQLEVARGQVRCNQCMEVFNALLTLENFTGNFEDPVISLITENMDTGSVEPTIETIDDSSEEKLIAAEDVPVTLRQAMYGEDYRNKNSLKPLLWTSGILLMIIAIIVQVIYYKRYQLISSEKYQTQIINLCQILPCDTRQFRNLSQIKLIERNVFTHPTRDNALMVTGLFQNEASFYQAIPKLKISLSDIQGNLIANRLFTPEEFMSNAEISRLPPGKAIQFRLELVDPGTEALTYEFEFST
mgnify:FL=1